MLTIALTTAFTFGFTVLFMHYLVRRDQKRIKASKEAKKQAKLEELVPYFIHQIELAETLNDVYIQHIKMWANGVRHPYFGPDEYGMFRTKDILLMNKEEVYLGNIWGLFTKSLPFWETQDTETQKLVLDQYKNQLISNLKTLIK